MYENIFTYNFILSFLFSSLFLIVNILFSIKVSNNLNIKKLFFFEEFQSIIIFFLIFCIYAFIFNLIILTNYKIISEIFFFIFLLQIIFVIDIFKNKKKFIKLNFSISEKSILLVFLSL